MGMAGFFAAAAKTPISTLIIVSEMTGGYHLLLPALWVCVLAFLLSDEKSIYSAQVESRSRSPAHQGSFVREVLQTVYVRQFLVREQVFHVVQPGDSLAAVLDRLDESLLHGASRRRRGEAFAGRGRLGGAHQAAHAGDLGPLLVAEDLMRSDVRPLTPDDTLDRALELFVENDVHGPADRRRFAAAEGDRNDPPPGDRRRLFAARAWHEFRNRCSLSGGIYAAGGGASRGPAGLSTSLDFAGKVGYNLTMLCLPLVAERRCEHFSQNHRAPSMNQFRILPACFPVIVALIFLFAPQVSLAAVKARWNLPALSAKPEDILHAAAAAPAKTATWKCSSKNTSIGSTNKAGNIAPRGGSTATLPIKASTTGRVPRPTGRHGAKKNRSSASA